MNPLESGFPIVLTVKVEFFIYTTTTDVRTFIVITGIIKLNNNNVSFFRQHST